MLVRIIGADFAITCNDKQDIIENGAVAISNGKILEVDTFENLKSRYIECESLFYKNHVMLPALINSHIHFEFSKNETSFRYGNFGKWLDSVMESRGSVLKNSKNAILDSINMQKKNGVGIVGAVSSYDLDLEYLLDSKLKVIYFQEVLGSFDKDFDNQAIDISIRLDKVMQFANPLFQPALALHSPYSTNDKIARYVIDLALKHNLLLSTHFLESKEELEWLRDKSGYFKTFYDKYLGVSEHTPNFDIDSFTDLFKDIRTLFIHCLYADDELRQKILDNGGYIVSCPRSNTLLNSTMGDCSIIATDGKSSNINVSLLDELRYALMVELSRGNDDIEGISRSLIDSVTCNPARALNIESGILESKRCADIAIFKLECKSRDNLLSSFILNAKYARKLLINGNHVKVS